jgi:hypothetical protein
MQKYSLELKTPPIKLHQGEYFAVINNAILLIKAKSYFDMLEMVQRNHHF